jgi:putative addiction module CopG family antidote
MNVSVPTEFVPFVRGLISEGAYATPDEVVQSALAAMRDRREKFDELKSSIEEGLAELDATGGKPLDFDEIKQKGRERLQAYRQQSS